MKQLTAILTLLFFAAAAYADGLAGKWKASVETGDGAMEIVYEFKLDGDKLSGTVTGPMGSYPITDGKLDGEAVTFAVSTENNKFIHKGKLSGDELKLSVDTGGGNPREFVAKRVKE